MEWQALLTEFSLVRWALSAGLPDVVYGWQVVVTTAQTLEHEPRRTRLVESWPLRRTRLSRDVSNLF